MRIKKNINKGTASWSNTKFSKLTLLELYGKQCAELMMRSWEWKGEYKRPKQADYETVAIISFISLFFEIVWAKSEEHALLYNLSTEIFPTSNNWLCHSISISTQPIYGRHKCDPCPSPKFS